MAKKYTDKEREDYRLHKYWAGNAYKRMKKAKTPAMKKMEYERWQFHSQLAQNILARNQ